MDVICVTRLYFISLFDEVSVKFLNPILKFEIPYVTIEIWQK